MAELGNEAQTFRNSQVTVGWHRKGLEDTNRTDRTSETHHLGSVTSRKGLMCLSCLRCFSVALVSLWVTAGPQHCQTLSIHQCPSDHTWSCPPLENQHNSIITESWNGWVGRGFKVHPIPPPP